MTQKKNTHTEDVRKYITLDLKKKQLTFLLQTPYLTSAEVWQDRPVFLRSSLESRIVIDFSYWKVENPFLQLVLKLRHTYMCIHTHTQCILPS